MQRIVALSDEEELRVELTDTREALAVARGRLIENHKTNKLIITICDCQLAVNVFLFLLLLAVGMGWI